MVIFLISVGAIGILIFILPYLLISATPFSQPSGEWHVGTSNLIWDKPDLPGIIAKVWYPTDVKHNTLSPYIDNIDLTFSALTAGMNLLFKFIFNKRYFDWIQIPASIGAIPANSDDGFPVILFSPGLGGISFLNTFYALEFASHGFIVIGIDHPGSCACSILSDGNWIGNDEVTKELLKDPNRKLEQLFGKIISQQSRHISTIIDKLMNLNSSSDSLLYQRINLNKIFCAGHSSGGAASFISCGKDLRISKAINLDGYFLDVEETNYVGKELLLIQSDRDRYPKNKALRSKYGCDLSFAKDKERIEQFYVKAKLKQIVMQSSGHLNFCDIPLIINPAFGKAIGFTGDVDGCKLLKETAAIAIEFFNRET